MAPRSFYLCPTLINIADSALNQQSQNQDMMTGWSARINATSALFDLMSSNTNIDHPLCEECADQLVNQLDMQCKIIEKEHSDYTNLIAKLNQQTSNDSEIKELEKELAQLEMEEKELIKQLESAEMKEKELVKEKEELMTEEANILHQEQAYLLEYSNYKRQLLKLEEKQESLDNQLRNTKFHFNRLRTVNVLNATFHIWHSGPFGTINYFRLGRLSDTPVEWEEINAGLGQVNLLLHCLTKKVKLEFKRFRLVPFGNYSYIEVIENCSGPFFNCKIGEELHMYRFKGFKYFFEWDGKFDSGMVAFLDCLQQFEDKIKSMDPQFSMPYRINGYKLEDKLSPSSYSIKCQFNSCEEWTKALKYMLTNLKWSLAWVTSQNDIISK
jgi:beclin 1